MDENSVHVEMTDGKLSKEGQHDAVWGESAVDSTLDMDPPPHSDVDPPSDTDDPLPMDPPLSADMDHHMDAPASSVDMDGHVDPPALDSDRHMVLAMDPPLSSTANNVACKKYTLKILNQYKVMCEFCIKKKKNHKNMRWPIVENANNTLLRIDQYF